MIKTFGKAALEIDRYAGLRLRIENNPPENIHGWDETKPSLTITGKLLVTQPETVIWEGTLFTRDQIGEVFVNTNPDGSPITFARRNGRNGRAKRVGVIRMASRDGESFELQRCNGGEELQEILHEGDLAPEIVLQLIAAQHSLRLTIFDTILHENRIKRLRDK